MASVGYLKRIWKDAFSVASATTRFYQGVWDQTGVINDNCAKNLGKLIHNTLKYT